MVIGVMYQTPTILQILVPEQKSDTSIGSLDEGTQVAI